MRVLLFSILAFAAVSFAQEEDAQRLPAGPGRDAVAQACLNCHGSGYFRRLRLDKDQWSDKVADMVERGAKVSDPQAAAIVEYLSTTFGPGAKIFVNTAPFEELKAVLSLTNEETQAVVAYRKEKGSFRSLDELMRVPGVDGKKIENRKESIAF